MEFLPPPWNNLLYIHLGSPQIRENNALLETKHENAHIIMNTFEGLSLAATEVECCVVAVLGARCGLEVTLLGLEVTLLLPVDMYLEATTRPTRNRFSDSNSTLSIVLCQWEMLYLRGRGGAFAPVSFSPPTSKCRV